MAYATTRADTRSGARRRGCVRAVLGLDPSARGSMSVCGVNANPKQGSRKVGVLCSASATAEQDVCGGGSAGVQCLGTDVGHGLQQLVQKE